MIDHIRIFEPAIFFNFCSLKIFDKKWLHIKVICLENGSSTTYLPSIVQMWNLLRVVVTESWFLKGLFFS